MKTLPQIVLTKKPSKFEKIKISSSQNSADYIRQFYTGDIELFESFFLVLLNNNLETTGYVKISQGGITGTVVDVRIVCKYAIESLATSVIVSHNHPSGTLKPSEADKFITKKLKEALKFFDINLLDHLIITAESHFSFADNEIL
jgi:DNA repair protein RadC